MTSICTYILDLNGNFDKTALLFISVTVDESAGIPHCTTTENKFRALQLLLRILVTCAQQHNTTHGTGQAGNTSPLGKPGWLTNKEEANNTRRSIS